MKKAFVLVAAGAFLASTSLSQAMSPVNNPAAAIQNDSSEAPILVAGKKKVKAKASTRSSGSASGPGGNVTNSRSAPGESGSGTAGASGAGAGAGGGSAGGAAK